MTFQPLLSGTIALTSDPLTIDKDLTILGPAFYNPITVSGNNATRVFHVTGTATDLAISKLTIANGFALSPGGTAYPRANIGRPYEAALGGAAEAGGPGRMLTFCGVTVTPGRTRWIPFTITHSLGASPSSTARSPPCIAPSFTGRYSTTFCSFTTRTYFRS